MTPAWLLPCACGKPAMEGHGHCLHCRVRIHAERGHTSMAYGVGFASGLSEQQVDAILQLRARGVGRAAWASR